MDRSPTEIFALKAAKSLKQIIPEGLWRAIKLFAVRNIFSGDLCMLATIFGTDKWGDHWYAQHYERHFAERRRHKLTVLEIGIGGFDDPRGGGASLRMWKHYFPNSQIHGVDIHDKTPHQEDRIRTYIGDQSDEKFLTELIAEIGTPDIIIDDGSHLNHHVIKSFEILFPLLAENGIYVVEDTSTSYWPDFGGSSEDLLTSQGSMIKMKALVDGLNHQEFKLPDYKPSYFDQNIVSLDFYHNLVFIHKGKNTEKGHG